MDVKRNILLDIVNHTGGLGFIETVKITGTDDETLIEAMDDDKTVIVKGKLIEQVPALNGEFGMNGLSVLTAFLNYPNYKVDGVKIEVQTFDRDGVDTPEEIRFTDKEGQGSRYRLMSPELVPSQAKFLGAQWDVEVSPSRNKIEELGYMCQALSAYETFILVKTVNKELRFWIGDENSASHGSFIIFDKNITGELKEELRWPANKVLTILKLTKPENITMHFSDRGALMITVKSDLASYDYILPARKR